MYLFGMCQILRVMVGRRMGVKTVYKGEKYFRIK